MKIKNKPAKTQTSDFNVLNRILNEWMHLTLGACATSMKSYFAFWKGRKNQTISYERRVISATF